MAPVVAEGFLLGIGDPPMLVRGHRPDLDAVRECRIADAVEQVAPHQEEVPNRGEPDDGQERPVAAPAESSGAHAYDRGRARDVEPARRLGRGHASPPYFRSMCRSTDLWMIFQVRRYSARARGSVSRAARATSRSSLRWLASRSSVSRPWPIASRTAQPGSPS